MLDMLRIQSFPLGLTGVQLAVLLLLAVSLILWGKGALRAVGIMVVITTVIAWYPPLGFGVAILVLIKVGLQSWLKRLRARPNYFAIAVFFGIFGGFAFGMYFLYR